MQEQTEYEVWKLVENQGRCYASTDCVGGVTLAAYLKHHPVVPQELLLRWMKEIPRELEKFHRCRGNPCFQYVNPFSIIIGSEGTVHLLNLESGKQKELLKKMRRREVRESFQREDNKHYQRISMSDDIYSLGRTYQYVFAAADTAPPICRRDRRRLQRIIAVCLSQDPGRETERKFKKQYHNFQEISDQFSKIQSENKRISKKKLLFPILAAVLLILFFGAGRSVLDGKGRMKKQLEREAQNQTENRESEKPRQAEDTLDRQEETKLRFDLGFLYFLDLEDYEKSREIFAGAAKTEPLGACYEKLSAYLASGEEMEEKELADLLGQIEEQIPDREDFRYYYSLLRGYRHLTAESAKRRVIEIGTHCLELEGWKEKDEEGRKQKEILRELAAAYEQTEEIANAARVYEELLDMEESSEQREQIYEKLVLLYEKNNDQEKAWEVCSQGIEELKDSGTLRIQFIRMQCQNSGTDRQICAQTIQKYLKEVPGIASDEEFKKLKAIYDIKVEGENVWVGR